MNELRLYEITFEGRVSHVVAKSMADALRLWTEPRLRDNPECKDSPSECRRIGYYVILPS